MIKNIFVLKPTLEFKSLTNSYNKSLPVAQIIPSWDLIKNCPEFNDYFGEDAFILDPTIIDNEDKRIASANMILNHYGQNICKVTNTGELIFHENANTILNDKIKSLENNHESEEIFICIFSKLLKNDNMICLNNAEDFVLHSEYEYQSSDNGFMCIERIMVHC